MSLAFIIKKRLHNCFYKTLYLGSNDGNIQGGGRKCLGHFKRHFGSQIHHSSQQSHQANKAKFATTKNEFYHIILCHLVISMCMRL